MSNETEIKEKNRELELERALKFWEMQELIKFQLRNYLFTLNAMRHETQVNAICDLLEEIESI